VTQKRGRMPLVRGPKGVTVAPPYCPSGKMCINDVEGKRRGGRSKLLLEKKRGRIMQRKNGRSNLIGRGRGRGGGFVSKRGEEKPI